MDHDEGRKAAETEAGPTQAGAGEGPTGRTRREEQRRRLIIAGASTPALMTLPSRRVWAAKCTKSKLLSGNLSAKKAGDGCGPLGCKATSWDDGNPVGAVDWTGLLFDESLTGDLFFTKSVDMLMAVRGVSEDSINNYDERFGTGSKDVLSELKGAAKEFAAAWLNANFIQEPYIPDIYRFELSTSQVAVKWWFSMTSTTTDYKLTAEEWLDDDPRDVTYTAAGKSVLELALDAGVWSKLYLKYDQMEPDAAKRDAAKGHFDAAKNAINDLKSEMQLVNEKDAMNVAKTCPFFA